MPDKKTVANLYPTHECPICHLPYWIARKCSGRFDHAAGERIKHSPVMNEPMRPAKGEG